MTDDTTVQETEFVFRRLADGIRLGHREFSPVLWVAILVPIVVAGLAYVVWMYRRDSRSITKAWAVFLSCLRATVYLLLATIFLLPAWQVWDRTESRSKAVLLFDVSGSMATKDDLPTEAIPVEKLLSRQDKVIRFLNDDQIAFLKQLQEKNPVTAYRFGGLLDDAPRNLNGGQTLSVSDWSAWLKPDAKLEIPADLPESEKAPRRKKADLAALLVNATNLGDAVLGVLNHESGHMLQGIVVLTDGRSSQVPAQTIDDVRARADKIKVPIFTVAVGEVRPQVHIRITDVQAPEQARPDDSFPVRVEMEGEGLAGNEVDVSLEVTRPGGEKSVLKPNLRPGETLSFRPGQPPRAQAEFEINQPGDEGEWKLVARVPRDRREAFSAKEHVSEPVTVHVVKRPIRVLLFAGAPTRDYQFARSLFVRETDRHRAEVSIYLQLGRSDIVQDVPPERLLRHFPNVLSGENNPKETVEERYYNLARYDLVIAFDPDWTQLAPEEMALLEKWVGTHAGGLILVLGPVNTYQLSRSVNFEKVKPILDLFPVLLEDSRLQGFGADRVAADPWRLNFLGANADMQFLKLDETGKDALAGWEEFFNGTTAGGAPGGEPHGFYSSYPVKSAKPNATVIATFTDPRARLPDGKEQPYLVTMPYGNGRVVYIGSGEIWRLREHRDVFHERFWTKLARYAGSGNLSRATKNGYISTGPSFRANQYVPITARLFGPDMQPLSPSERPKAEIKPATGGTPIALELLPKASQAAEASGWFEARFLATAPGAYEIRIQIPGTAEVLSRKFVVKESNPELDNTTPDLETLARLASDAGPVLSRVSGVVKEQVAGALEQTNRIHKSDTAQDQESLRLYFDLQTARLIPLCMVTERKTQKSRGPIQDIWDDGPVVRTGQPPLKISVALIIIVGLLSTEWLVRKLLKLA
jgi:hypothetical protein